MVSHFAPTIPAWDSCRILRRMVFRGTPVAICAACPTVEHQSHFAPTVFSWDTVRNLRQHSQNSYFLQKKRYAERILYLSAYLAYKYAILWIILHREQSIHNCNQSYLQNSSIVRRRICCYLHKYHLHNPHLERRSHRLANSQYLEYR